VTLPIWKRVTDRVHPPCALCGGTDVEVLSATDIFDSQLPTVICRDCGLIFTSPRLPSEAYARLYVEDYRRLYGLEPPDPVDDAYLHLRNDFEVAERRWEHYRALLGDSPRLLDVGAGFAVFGGVVHQRLPGADVVVVEPDVRAAAFAAERWGIASQACAVEDADLAEGSFTHLCLFHVLEHVEHPPEFLIAVGRFLQDDGLLFVEVPNIASPWDGIGMLHPAHLTQFTTETLALTLQRAGFKVIGVTTWDEGDLALSMSMVARKRVALDAPATVETRRPDVGRVQADFARRLRNAPRDIRVRRAKHLVGRVLGPSLSNRLRLVLRRLRGLRR